MDSKLQKCLEEYRKGSTSQECIDLINRNTDLIRKLPLEMQFKILDELNIGDIVSFCQTDDDTYEFCTTNLIFKDKFCKKLKSKGEYLPECKNPRRYNILKALNNELSIRREQFNPRHCPEDDIKLFGKCFFREMISRGKKFDDFFDLDDYTKLYMQTVADWRGSEYVSDEGNKQLNIRMKQKYIFDKFVKINFDNKGYYKKIVITFYFATYEFKFKNGLLQYVRGDDNWKTINNERVIKQIEMIHGKINTVELNWFGVVDYIEPWLTLKQQSNIFYDLILNPTDISSSDVEYNFLRKYSNKVKKRKYEDNYSYKYVNEWPIYEIKYDENNKPKYLYYYYLTDFIEGKKKEWDSYFNDENFLKYRASINNVIGYDMEREDGIYDDVEILENPIIFKINDEGEIIPRKIDYKNLLKK